MPDPVITTDTTTTTSTTDTGAKPWYDGHDAELVGHYQNKGWDKLTPAEAAREAAKAHREAERFVGVPADQIVRLPKDANDQEGLNALQLRLGRPQTANDYKFDAVKFSDGSALDNGFADTMKQLAFNNGLSQVAAEKVAEGFVKYQESQAQTQSAEATAALATQRAELQKNWGANFDAMMLVAKNAATALGIKPEVVNALEGQIGYKGVMEMFANIGSKIGEDKFISNINPNAPGVTTREQAVARKAELMADKTWTERYLAGGAAESKEMTALLTIITGDDTQESRAY